MEDKKIKLRSGDKVVVLAGKDKGKIGKILEVVTSSNAVVVEGVNIVSKHKKAKSAQDKGGIIKREQKIDLSNVEIICPNCKKATKVSYGEENGKKFRKCKKCGASLDKGIEIKKAAKAVKADKKDVKPVATKIEKPAAKAAVTKKVVKDTTKKITEVSTKRATVRKTADKKG